MIEFLKNPRFWALEFKSIGQLAVFIPMIAVLLKGVKLDKLGWRVLAFVCFTLVMEFVAISPLTLHLFNDTTNAGWYHLGTPILFLLIFRIHLVHLSKKMPVWLVWFIPVVFFLVALVYAMTGDNFSGFPVLTIGLYAAAGILLPILYLKELLEKMSVEFVERDPLFLISTGMLIYYSANFLLWSTLSFTTFDASVFYPIYRINAVATLVLNMFFALAIFQSPQPLKQP